jgi:hypothetical protein
MADTRTLKLSLLADVNKFLAGMDKADKGTKTFSSQIGKYSKAMAKSFAIAGAAAGAYAIKLGVDGVKSAVEDELSQKKLAQALKNTAGATDDQIKATEDYIKKQQISFGIADTKLRPALANLARATGDITEAQKLNNLAIDISAATGKDLESVSLALSKAYNGNLGALTKLGIPLDKNIIKTKDFDAATKVLTETFAGSAKANTETFAGQLAILQERFGEIQEDIGAKLIPKLKLLLENVNLVAKGFSGEDPEGLTSRARELAGEYNGNGASSLGGSLRAVADAFSKLFGTITDDGDPATNTLTRLAESLEKVANALETLERNWGKVANIFRFLQNPLNLNVPEAGFTPRNSSGSRAAGGSVMARQAYRVGEFGPEMFVPSSSGSVRPAGNQGTTVININGVVDAASARRSIERVLQTQSRVSGPINLAGAMP